MSTKLRLGMVAPRGRTCGIGDYADFLAKALGPEFELFWIDLPTTSSFHAWKQAATRTDFTDVVHVHFEPSLFNIPRPYINCFAPFMNRLRPPALVTLHDALPQLKPLWMEKQPYSFFKLARDLAYLPHYWSWERLQYKRAAHWIVHSPELESRVRKLAGRKRVSSALHPVPPVGQVWSHDDDHPLDLISPGFVKAHKGYLELLDLLPEMQKVTWELAGGPQDAYDQTFADRFKDKVGQLGLEGRIRLTGYLARSDLEGISIRSKAAIFPFRWAAGSGSLTWAIGMGLPILATDLPALLQFKAAGAGIKLLPLQNRETWPELINSVLSNPAEQSALSQANLKFARKYDYAEFARLIKDIYQRLAQSERT